MTINKVAWIHILDKKLLTTRSKGKSVFYIPGGKREKGESDKETLAREILEELNVQIDDKTIKPMGVFTAQADGFNSGINVQMS